MTGTTMLLDAPSMYFRAFFGIPESITAPDGRPANAVRGFLDMVAWLIAERRPTHLVSAMDADWRPAFRVAALPSYKAHRVAEETPAGAAQVEPETLPPQVDAIEAILAALGIASFGVEGYEADDVLGTLAAKATTPAEVVSGDRDLFQLVDDAREVRVLYIGRGVSKYAVMDEAAVAEKYRIPGRAYAEYATLRGDPSDGLPGVAGIGDKTAASLITKYGTVSALLGALDAGDTSLASGVRTKLSVARDYLAAAPVVVNVALDVPLPHHAPRLPSEPRDPERLLALVDEWGVESSLERILKALATSVG